MISFCLFGIVTGSLGRLSGILGYVLSEECFDLEFTSDHLRTTADSLSEYVST